MKRTILFGIIIVFIVGIGEEMHVDEQEEMKELSSVQEDLVN